MFHGLTQDTKISIFGDEDGKMGELRAKTNNFIFWTSEKNSNRMGFLLVTKIHLLYI